LLFTHNVIENASSVETRLKHSCCWISTAGFKAYYGGRGVGGRIFKIHLKPTAI
jgi:hypothetical protein